jgi:hygromycin-B 7''-O-kinase
MQKILDVPSFGHGSVDDVARKKSPCVECDCVGREQVLLLPKIDTLESYRRIYRDAEVWLPAMRAICQRHSLDASRLEFAPPGTHVVFTIGGPYLKLFAPLWPGDFAPERLVLNRLSEGRDLPVPTPRLVAEGEIEGWPYLVMTAVEGVPVCQVWDGMDATDRERVAVRCGELMAALHTVPTEGLEAIAVDWPAFVEGQKHECIDGIGRAGLDKRWTREVRDFFAGLPPLFELGFEPVLLSADVTDEHILVGQRKGRWEVTGYIDFGDAMLRHPDYEFAAPGCCITRGSPRLQRAMLLAYGYTEEHLGADLARRLMAYTLIHKFINVPELLKLLGLPETARLEVIQEGLWAFF